MKRTNKVKLLVFSGLLSGGLCSAQTPDRTPTSVAESTSRIRSTIQNEQRVFTTTEQLRDEYSVFPQLRTGNIPLSKRDKELISMDERDKPIYSAFLNSADTGYFRLFDAADCSTERQLIDSDEPCPWNVPGKATSYSFRREDYSVQFFADVQFEKAEVRVSGVNLLGFFTDLGDVSIENLDLSSSGISEMAKFVPSVETVDVKRQSIIAQNGFQIGDHIYKTILPMRIGATYSLRAIAYRSDIYLKVGKHKFNPFKNDKRKDVIVVFRVIRQHEDGSVSILFKKLHETNAPKLK